MSNTVIQIKRSLSTSQPPSLSVGELAYSYQSNTAFIGTPDGTGVIAIGGKSYLDIQNNIYTIVNSAFNAANSQSASLTAANQAGVIANAAFDLTNTTFGRANSIYDLANAAFEKANSDTGVANSVNAYVNVSTSAANNYAGFMANAANAYAGTLGSAAFDKANNALANTSGTVFDGNLFISANIKVGANLFLSNTGHIYNRPNSSGDGLGYDTIEIYPDNRYSNGLIIDPTAPNHIHLRGTGTQDNAIGDLFVGGENSHFQIPAGLNPAPIITSNGSSWTFQNGGSLLFPDTTIQYTAYSNIVYNTANAAFDKANAANVLAYDTGIGANGYAVTIGASGNAYANLVGSSANNYANDTFVKLTAASQTITGDFSITGNLFIGGNTTAVSANNLIVNDPLIYLANGNPSDILDIGFVGSYTNGTSAHVHTGLFRDHASKQYYLFQGFDANPELNNDITPYSNNMVNATLVADLITSNLTLGGANAILWISAAYDKANAANVLAYDTGIGANGYASAVGVAANLYADAVGTAANTNAANGSYITTGIVKVGVGGTGVTSFTTNGIVFGNNTGDLKVTAAGTEGQVLQASSTGVPQFGMLDGGNF